MSQTRLGAGGTDRRGINSLCHQGASALGWCLCRPCRRAHLQVHSLLVKTAADFPLMKHQHTVLIFKGETDI